MNCQRCGALIVAQSTFCENCGTPVEADQSQYANQSKYEDASSRAGTSAPFADAPPPYGGVPPQAGPPLVPAASPRAAVPNGRGVLPDSPIQLGHGEVLWRRYEAVRLRSRKRGVGTLYVTDARVVFFAWATGRGTQGRSQLVQQVKLEDVRGFSAYVTNRLSTFLLVLTIWSGLATIGTLFSLLLPLTLLFAILTGVCFALLFTEWAQRGYAGVTLQARHVSDSAVDFGGRPASNNLLVTLLLWPMLVFVHVFLRSYTAFDVVFGRPGKDSEAIIAELGALIMDLQTQGTYASQHWGVQGEGPASSRALS